MPRTAVLTADTTFFGRHDDGTLFPYILPEGTPVIIEGWERHTDGSEYYDVETEYGDFLEGVEASRLDFEADF